MWCMQELPLDTDKNVILFKIQKWGRNYCISADILCVMIYAYYMSQESHTEI